MRIDGLDACSHASPTHVYMSVSSISDRTQATTNQAPPRDLPTHTSGLVAPAVRKLSDSPLDGLPEFCHGIRVSTMFALHDSDHCSG